MNKFFGQTLMVHVAYFQTFGRRKLDRARRTESLLLLPCATSRLSLCKLFPPISSLTRLLSHFFTLTKVWYPLLISNSFFHITNFILRNSLICMYKFVKYLWVADVNSWFTCVTLYEEGRGESFFFFFWVEGGIIEIWNY